MIPIRWQDVYITVTEAAAVGKLNVRGKKWVAARGVSFENGFWHTLNFKLVCGDNN